MYCNCLHCHYLFFIPALSLVLVLITNLAMNQEEGIEPAAPRNESKFNLVYLPLAYQLLQREKIREYLAETDEGNSFLGLQHFDFQLPGASVHGDIFWRYLMAAYGEDNDAKRNAMAFEKAVIGVVVWLIEDKRRHAQFTPELRREIKLAKEAYWYSIPAEIREILQNNQPAPLERLRSFLS